MTCRRMNAGIAIFAIFAMLSSTAMADIVDIGSGGVPGEDGAGELLASGWIRSDSAANNSGTNVVFVGTGGSTDFRGYLAFDLSSFNVGDTINSATVQLFSEGAETFNANGDLGDAAMIGLNVTSMLVDLTGINIDGAPAGSELASYDNLVNNGDQYGAVLDTVVLDLDGIAQDDQVNLNVTGALQAAVDNGAAKISFGLTSPDAIATGARNFFAFDGIGGNTGGSDIAANLQVDVTPIPEPTTVALLVVGSILGMNSRRRVR